MPDYRKKAFAVLPGFCIAALAPAITTAEPEPVESFAQWRWGYGYPGCFLGKR